MRPRHRAAENDAFIAMIDTCIERFNEAAA